MLLIATSSISLLFAVLAGAAQTPSSHTLLAAPAGPPPDAIKVSLVRVIDGDTIDVRMPNNSFDRVRLLFIDTPERTQPGYNEATEALQKLLGCATVRLEYERPGVVERCKYGRILAHVWADGALTSVAMIKGGYTAYWTQYGTSARHGAELAGAIPDTLIPKR